MAVPILDTTRTPIWLVRFADAVTVDEHRIYLARVIASCREGERYGLVLDFRNFNPWSAGAETRAGVAQAVSENMPTFERFIVAEVRIVPNPLLRAMASVFDWSAPFPWPTRNVASMGVAESWIRSRMAQVGITVGDDPIGES